MVAILTLTTDELMKGISDNAKSALQRHRPKDRPVGSPAQACCASTTGPLPLRLEEHFLAQFRGGKVPRCWTRSTKSRAPPNGIPATLSVGIGRDADTFQELYQYASLSVEMALLGDQVVIKNKFSF